MQRSYLTLVAVLASLLIAASVTAAPQPVRTFVAIMTAAEEVPTCTPATNASRGMFLGHVTNESAGTVEWMLVANNLPGTTVTAAHIHIAPRGVAGPIVQGLFTTPQAGDRVMQTGEFTNPDLLAALRANPGNYYVNVHTNACPPGAIRGQLGTQGP